MSADRQPLQPAGNGADGSPGGEQRGGTGPDHQPPGNVGTQGHTGATPGQPGRRRRGGGARAERIAILEERRTRVWMLALVRKLSVREIAQVVGVGKSTVDRDLLTVRRRTHAVIRATGRMEQAVLQMAAQIIETCDAVARQAWADLMEAPKGSSTRARFLRIILGAVAEQVKLLQSLGVMKRVPEEVVIGGFELEQRLQRLSDEDAAAAIALLDQICPPIEGATGGNGGRAQRPASVDREPPLDTRQAPPPDTTAPE